MPDAPVRPRLLWRRATPESWNPAPAKPAPRPTRATWCGGTDASWCCTSLVRGPPHLQRCALHDSGDQRRHPVIFLRGLARDGAHGRKVIILNSTAERINQQLFSGGG